MKQTQRILLIDDSEDIHHLVRARLKGLGVEVLDANEGTRGLEMVREIEPDLILLDVNMPDISGFDLCKQLKDDAQTHDIPVIFLTGENETVNKVKGFDLGAVDYVTKPFDPAELRARVRAALKTKELVDALATQAQIDGLTQLHNRRYFDRRLSAAITEGRRYKRAIGLLLIDVDHFKSINDAFGHPKGDLVLRRLAELLRVGCRESDVACRYGGEEFTLILPESTSDQTYQSGLRLLETVRQCSDFVSIIGRPVTVSIGAATAMPDDQVTPAALVAQADKALYSAKESGRDRVAAA